MSLLGSKVPLPSSPSTSFRVVYSHVRIATSHGYFTIILKTGSLRIKVTWDSRVHFLCPTADLLSQQLWEQDPAMRVSQTLQVNGILLTQRTTVSLPLLIQVAVSTRCAETTPPNTLVFPVCLASTSSVQFSCSVMFDSLRPCGLQHARPPCPSPAPGVYSNSCPSSQ